MRCRTTQRTTLAQAIKIKVPRNRRAAQTVRYVVLFCQTDLNNPAQSCTFRDSLSNYGCFLYNSEIKANPNLWRKTLHKQSWNNAQTNKNKLPKQLVRSVGCQYGVQRVLLNLTIIIEDAKRQRFALWFIIYNSKHNGKYVETKGFSLTDLCDTCSEHPSADTKRFSHVLKLRTKDVDASVLISTIMVVVGRSVIRWRAATFPVWLLWQWSER